MSYQILQYSRPKLSRNRFGDVKTKTSKVINNLYKRSSVISGEVNSGGSNQPLYNTADSLWDLMTIEDTSNFIDISDEDIQNGSLDDGIVTYQYITPKNGYDVSINAIHMGDYLLDASMLKHLNEVSFDTSTVLTTTYLSENYYNKTEVDEMIDDVKCECGEGGSGSGSNYDIVVITRSDYDRLATKNPNTIYMIYGS